MGEYYGFPTTSTDDFLMHYGVRGMKWGVRKAIERTGKPRSKAYSDAEKKLKRATMFGGVIGGLSYAAKNRDQFSNKKKTSKIKAGVNKPITQGSRRNALEASRRAEEARNNLSALGKRGFGKTARAYKKANAEARAATNAYYNSLSKKKYAAIRRNHVG